MDLNTKKDIAKGKIKINATCDLHGLTASEAYETTIGFIYRAVERHYKTLLFITGKGENNQGVLKTSLPNWLESSALSDYVSTYSEAGNKHGGAGAYYVRLRKTGHKS